MSSGDEAKKLIEETEWMRVYRVGRTERLESKFLKDGIEVSADSIKQRWHEWGPVKQLDFANAFKAKPVLTTEDQEILRFLMESGSELTWGAIAYLLPRYSDRERAFSFLLEQAAAGGRCVANYYQALERMGDTRAVPLLRERYEQYRRKLVPLEGQGLHSGLSEYDVCCRALWKLDGSQEYEDALKSLLTHPDESIRRRAHYYLFDQWPQQK